jgi:hydroxyquinol 1,2-dioxygenase
MRQFNEDTLTDAVIARLKDAKNPRFRQIITSLVKHAHAFAREVELTEEEWFEGIKFLTAVGQKCDGKRQEFILMSDVLGLSMMVVALNHKTAPGATEATVLGPFFAHGAKEYGYGADLREGATMKGDDVWVSGKVLEVDKDGVSGKPIPNAALDIWQAKADGIYDLQTEGEFELRGRVKANAEGEYAFASYKPKFYSIPMDGPVGDLVRATSNNHMRPAHMHAIVSAPGYQQVITHVFVEGDPYLDGDAVFAVKNSLVGKYKKVNNAAEAKKLGLSNPFLKLEFDFRLSPDKPGAKKARKKIAASDAVA